MSDAVLGAPVSRGCFRTLRNREIHLPFESINSGHKDRELVADAKPFARASANELPSSRFKQIKVVRERRHMDEAGD